MMEPIRIMIFNIVTITTISLFNYNYLDWVMTKKQFLVQLFSSIAVTTTFHLILGSFSGIILLLTLWISNLLITKRQLLSIVVPAFLFLVCIVSFLLATLIEQYFYVHQLIDSGSILAFWFSRFLFLLVICIPLLLLLKPLYKWIFLNKTKMNRSSAFPLSLLLLMIAIFYVNHYFEETVGAKADVYFLLNHLFFFVYFVIMVVVIRVYIASVTKSNEAKVREEELANLKIYSENLEQMYTGMRVFRHDYINILSSMSAFINDKDYEGLTHFFNEKILKTKEEVQLNNTRLDTLANIKITEVKGVLAAKLFKAQSLGIITTFEAPILTNLNVDSIVICRIIGILLDNAIEECMQMNDAALKVGFIESDQAILFVVQNSCRKTGYKLHQLMEDGFSTKGKGRGLGLSNLKMLIDQNQGLSLDTSLENKLFIQQIKIDLSYEV